MEHYAWISIYKDKALVVSGVDGPPWCGSHAIAHRKITWDEPSDDEENPWPLIAEGYCPRA